MPGLTIYASSFNSLSLESRLSTMNQRYMSVLQTLVSAGYEVVAWKAPPCAFHAAT
jgi:hypothetical protein